MGKLKLVHLFLLVVIIFPYASCSSNIQTQISEIIIDKFAEESLDSCIIDINEVIPFDWTEMYVFQPWTMTEDIQNAINNKGYNRTYVKDDMRRLLFLNNGIIVYEEDYNVFRPKRNFDFIDRCISDSKNYCKFTSSKFKVNKANNHYFYLLPLE